MRKTVIRVAAVTAIMSLGLAACGDDKDKDKAKSTASAAPSAAASGATSAAASGASSASAAPAAGKIKVGVILPDSKSSSRWETADRKFLKAAFEAAGAEVDIQNAEGDKGAFQTIADQMMTNGAKALVMVNLDSGSGKAVQDKAKAQGVATIDYDRLTLGGSAGYYVSFDNEAVGRLQGEGLQKCLEANGTKEGNIVYLNGSPTDNNATLFKAGYDGVLSKLTQYKKVDDQSVPDWKNDVGQTIFEQMYTKAAGKIDGVAAANDGLGNAVINVLKKNKVNGKIPVTGQDATDQGLQNILAGDQCMTVYKAIKAEAQAAADLAIALASGKEAPQADKVVKDGARDVKSVLLVPLAVDKTNIGELVKQMVSDEFTTLDKVCTADFKAKCTEAGIS
ncbi:MAG: substrate-binding domain-containing protein [Mycobacteriales bacterium]